MVGTGVGVVALVAGLVSVTGPAASAAPTGPGLAWGACPSGHGVSPSTHCATVRVPLDHARPTGPTIALTVAKIPARDQSRKRGVLVGNPGGPGGDGISMFSSVQPPEAVRDEWDLVTVQPRGLPGGTPVRCDPLSPNDQRIYTDFGGLARESCEKNTPGYTRTITTENTARDIESVRGLLGADRISLYGISYGTLLMSTYATLFPQHVDRLVLDSGVDPGWIWNDVLAEQTPHYRARVSVMMEWIAQRDNVYHLGKTPLQVYRAWSAKVAAEAGVPPSVAAPPARVGDVPPALRAIAQPYLDGVNATADVRARVENLVATLTTPGKVQTTSPLLALTRAGAPDRNLWPTIAGRINGSLKPPPQLPRKVLESIVVSQNMQQLILCNENAVPARPQDIPASWYANYIVGDVFDSPGLIYRSGMACAGAPPVTRPITLANKGLRVTPLQLQSIGDPQTPYGGSLSMRRMMRSHLITVGGGDHGQLGRSNRPLDAAITEYLRTGGTSVTSVPQAPVTANPNGVAGNSFIGTQG
ncbi:alpha/beta fold hydrolase [Gordonia soli]|uniref:Uncharacterized protein n=1 Tax=Gordonia soli NBRC 108243 TaxID=1223545 RepID=M0QEZ2_9ACTN|nr:alpha/beta fold hydrolase [Gordonia soli]GAC67180.1 hypothetical protein GS4_06_00260 [Gordonia soli NBRC 108243]